MTIFEKANYLIETIENAGFEAYQVGGCVRTFMKRKCDDIDITTSAKPGDLEKYLLKIISNILKRVLSTARLPLFSVAIILKSPLIEQTVSILITATLKMSAL